LVFRKPFGCFQHTTLALCATLLTQSTMGSSLVAIRLLKRSGERGLSATLLLDQQASGDKHAAALENLCFLLKVDKDTAQQVVLYASDKRDIHIMHVHVADATDLAAMLARSPGLFTTHADGHLTLWYNLPSTAQTSRPSSLASSDHELMKRSVSTAAATQDETQAP
jgi:hypothetical protein